MTVNDQHHQSGRLGAFLAFRRVRIGGFAAFVCGIVLVIGIRSMEAQQLAVLSRAEDALVYIDLTTGQELHRIDVGRMCHELAVDAARRFALTGSFRGNTVHAINLQERTSREFEIVGFSHFHGLALSPMEDVVFVTSEDSSAVLEVDPQTGAILRVWLAPGLRAHMVAVTPDGRKLYVGSEKPGVVMVIDRDTGETKILQTGTFTVDVDISPDGTEVWVAVRDEGKIAIIDIETDKITSTFDPGGNSPAKLQFHPKGNEVWITHHLGETVTVMDRESRSVIGTVTVGERPLGLTFNEDGSRVYVSRTRGNEIVEIDASTRNVIRRIPTPDNPDGMVWLPSAMTVPFDQSK